MAGQNFYENSNDSYGPLLTHSIIDGPLQSHLCGLSRQGPLPGAQVPGLPAPLSALKMQKSGVWPGGRRMTGKTLGTSRTKSLFFFFFK